MSIRILNHNGTARQLSARMTADFEADLRRIGEAPSSPTLNLWISNQTPEELLQILKRMPGRPADESARGGVQELQPEISVPEDSDRDTAAGHQVGEPKSDIQAVGLPHKPDYAAGTGTLWASGGVYNSVYQRETGHIMADPGGLGELVVRDGKMVNLRDEQREELALAKEREDLERARREREDRESRNGGNDEGNER